MNNVAGDANGNGIFPATELGWCFSSGIRINRRGWITAHPAEKKRANVAQLQTKQLPQLDNPAAVAKTHSQTINYHIKLPTSRALLIVTIKIMMQEELTEKLQSDNHNRNTHTRRSTHCQTGVCWSATVQQPRAARIAASPLAEQQETPQRLQPTPQRPEEAGDGAHTRRLGPQHVVCHRQVNRVARSQEGEWLRLQRAKQCEAGSGDRGVTQRKGRGHGSKSGSGVGSPPPTTHPLTYSCNPAPSVSISCPGDPQRLHTHITG